MLLTQAVVLEKIVELADDCVCPFPAITSFVAQKVDLSGNGLTRNSKHSTLPRGQEVDRTWLERVTWEVHLKRKRFVKIDHQKIY